jgi:predicted DNA binding CopG/RHH family protein
MERKSPPARLTPTQRVHKSVKKLTDSGGKRIMLRLTPEAYAALKKTMSTKGIKTETLAINISVIEYSLR